MISAIVFVKNGAEYIRENLLSLASALSNYPHEIIVSDGGSSDETLRIIDNLGISVMVVHSKLERSFQVNEGATYANGKYVFITGVDILYNPKYFEEALAACEGGADAVYTSVVTRGSGMIAAIKKYERDLYVNDRFHESARFIRLDVFKSLSGYDVELIAGEDYDFQRRLDSAGYKTFQVNSIAEYHLGEERDFAHVFRRAFYYGKSLPIFFKKNGARGILQMSPVRASFFTKKALSQPVLLIGLVTYKFVQTIGAACGIGITCFYSLGLIKRSVG